MHALIVHDTATGNVDVIHTCCDDATPLAMLDQLSADELIDYRTGVTDPDTGCITGERFVFKPEEKPDPQWPTFTERLLIVAKDYPPTIKAVLARAYAGIRFVIDKPPTIAHEHHTPHRH